jgi:hypothetical protein
VQKNPRIEVPSILGLIHNLPCFASFPHECNQHLGCHPAHSNWWRKGVGMKTSDFLVASLCANAHRMIDGKVGLDTLPVRVRQHYWIEAYISTWDYLWNQKLVAIKRRAA